jgi:DNA-binding transcriptional LysR family regulator
MKGRNMNLTHLRTFQKVVELGGVTRAAEQLGYAQSSITAQIQSLEQELGTFLFERQGKKLRLTSAGKTLLEYAEKILQLHDEAVFAIQNDAEPTGTLLIGSPESLAAFRLPAIIRQYKQKFPQMNLVVKPGLCWEMRQYVRKGELDVAFIIEIADNAQQSDDLVVIPLVKEEIVLVAPPDHPLAEETVVDPEHLRDETFLFTERGCSYRMIFEQELYKHGIKAEGEEFWSIEAIKNCVSAGLGISYLPWIAVKKELDEGKLIRLNWTRPSTLVTKMIYRKQKWISPALREWIKLTEQYAIQWREERNHT